MRELKQRWLPSIPQSLAVFAVWLLLMDGPSVLNLLTALLLGWCLPLLAARFDRELASIGKLRHIPSLVAHLLVDIVKANVTVALQVLGPVRSLRSHFVWIPLDLTNIHAISALASIISITPGTVSTALSPDRRHLLVHCLSTADPQRVVDAIKQRYEAPLRELFP
ncbi:MAG: Na+/H+ antiporter subunit E [Pseudoxanthomonas suwonensis]|nr:MAG: Na+/H+ antiporter subunit E [Pseudoxanthomonas suwonensis]